MMFGYCRSCGNAGFADKSGDPKLPQSLGFARRGELPLSTTRGYIRFAKNLKGQRQNLKTGEVNKNNAVPKHCRQQLYEKE